MSKPPELFLLDADVLITAHRSYYAFDICPGFWEAILEGHGRGLVYSIPKVRDEIMAGRSSTDGQEGDALQEWIETQVPDGFFRPEDVDVIRKYQAVISWSQNHGRYNETAKSDFAGAADSWLVAHGAAWDATVVTLEKSSPTSIKRVFLPDACAEFDIHVTNTWPLLRRLGATFQR